MRSPSEPAAAAGSDGHKVTTKPAAHARDRRLCADRLLRSSPICALSQAGPVPRRPKSSLPAWRFEDWSCVAVARSGLTGVRGGPEGRVVGRAANVGLGVRPDRVAPSAGRALLERDWQHCQERDRLKDERRQRRSQVVNKAVEELVAGVPPGRVRQKRVQVPVAALVDYTRLSQCAQKETQARVLARSTFALQSIQRSVQS